MLNWTGKQLQGKGGGIFTILHEIGRGGFGVVYLAQADAGIQYALKLLGPVEEQELRVSFEQEVKSTLGLDHPNLLNIHDYGELESDGQIWLFTVAEYCSNGDYRRTLSAYRQNPPPIQTVIHDIVQILQGLEVLHSRIIHRDLKPANVLCVGETLKITDFGLAIKPLVSAICRRILVREAESEVTCNRSCSSLYLAFNSCDSRSDGGRSISRSL
jgi:serine/threonine protein kinase